jgi:hypothetical protein
MLRKEVSYLKVAEMCKARGWPQKVGYLRQIGGGHNRPKWELCEFLATEIIKWPGAAVMIYRYPYKRLVPRSNRIVKRKK